MNLRTQLEPIIRAAGLLKIARSADISPSTLSQWLSGKIPQGSKRQRRLDDAQLERLAVACGQRINMTPCQMIDPATADRPG